jgi:AsmA protein
MKKFLKWLLIGVLGLALILAAAVVLLPRFFDPNEHKAEIESLVSEQIGRPVLLNGPIEWSVFPWLALTFHDVAVANEKGFRGDHLARIDSLSARLKVMPLLKKQLRVGTVAAKGADINLQVGRNGRSNWQGILDTLASAETTPAQAEASSAPDLKISGIRISDTTIHYTDRASDLQAVLSDLSLKTDRIESGQPVDARLQARLQLPDSGLTGEIKGRLQLHHLLDKAEMTVTLPNFALDGSLKTESGQVPLQLELTKPGELNIDRYRLDFPAIALSLANATLRTSASGNWSGQGNYAGTIEADAFNLREFLSTLGGSPLVFAKPEAMSHFSLRAPWKMTGNRLQLPKITAELDSSQITGAVDIRQLDQLKGRFNLRMDQITIDDYLPADNADASANTSSPSATPVGKLDFGHLQGEMRLDEARFAGARLHNTQLKLVTNGGRLEITPMRADFYKGLLNTQVLVDANAPKNKVTLKTLAKGIQVGPLMKDVAGNEWLKGLGSLTIDVALDDPFAAKPLKTTHGQIAYELSDGAIYGLDLMATIKEAVNTLQQLRGADAKGKKDQNISSTAAGKGKKTEFARILFRGDIDKGILTSRDISVQTPFLQVGGQLRIDLDAMTIDGVIEPMLTAIPEDWVASKYRPLLQLPIPVRLSGSLMEPTVRIDLAKLLLASQKKRIDKEKDKLKKKLLDQLLGGDSKDDKAEKEKAGQSDKESTKPGKDENTGEENQTDKKPESTEDKLKKKLLKNLFGDD